MIRQDFKTDHDNRLAQAATRASMDHTLPNDPPLPWTVVSHQRTVQVMNGETGELLPEHMYNPDIPGSYAEARTKAVAEIPS